MDGRAAPHGTEGVEGPAPRRCRRHGRRTDARAGVHDDAADHHERGPCEQDPNEEGARHEGRDAAGRASAQSWAAGSTTR